LVKKKLILEATVVAAGLVVTILDPEASVPGEPGGATEEISI